MAEKPQIEIKKIVIADSKISDIKFEYDKRMYIASLTPSDINIRRKGYGSGRVVGVYDRKGDLMWWSMYHACHLGGFDYRKHVCYACKSKKGITIFHSEANTLAPKEFPLLMRFINGEANRLEKILKNYF